jgi:hypothetical protein
VQVRRRIEQAERWFGRVRLLLWLTPSSVMTAITVWFGQVQAISFYWIVPYMIAAFTIPLLAIALLFFVVYKYPPPEKPNPAVWRTATVFRLRTAACLLADEANEASVDRPGDANAWFYLLDQDWKDGKLERVQRENERVTTRRSLKIFAMEHNVTRPFLMDS